MTPVATLPQPTRLVETLEKSAEHFDAILKARSKTVKIPPGIRAAMTAMKKVTQFWTGEVGTKVYATLFEEHKAAAKPKAKGAGG